MCGVIFLDDHTSSQFMSLNTDMEAYTSRTDGFFYFPPTAKEKGEKKLFGFSFVPLMQEDGRTLPDGTHELIVHKVTAVRGRAVQVWAELLTHSLILILEKTTKKDSKDTLLEVC